MVGGCGSEWMDGRGGSWVDDVMGGWMAKGVDVRKAGILDR